MNDQPSLTAWTSAEDRYQAGQQVQGMVTRVTQLGVFVQVEPGIEGILYAFELGTGSAAVASFTPGQEVQLYVNTVDASRKRLELSLGPTLKPGLQDERALPPALRRKTPSAEQSWPFPHMPGNVSEASHSICQTCQHQVLSSWKFCVYCGGSQQRRCPACGSIQPDLPDARYCHSCGRPV